MSISLKTSNHWPSQIRLTDHAEEDYDEPVTPRSQRSRSYLCAWLISIAIGVMLLCTFIIPRHPKFRISAIQSETLPFSKSIGTPEFTTNFIFGDDFSDAALGVSREHLRPVWTDYLAKYYVKAPLHTISLAQAGSVVNSSLVNNTVRSSLRDQVTTDFLPLYTNTTDPNAQWDPSTTLFTIWFGANDIILSHNTSIHIPIDSIMTSYRASLETLYNAGARNFLFVNVPPMEYISKRQKDVAGMQRDVDDFNKKLLTLRLNFMRDHAADIMSALYLDVHELWTQTMRHPEEFEQMKEMKPGNIHCLLDGTLGDDANLVAKGCGAVYDLTAAMMWSDCLEEEMPRRYCS